MTTPDIYNITVNAGAALHVHPEDIIIIAFNKHHTQFDMDILRQRMEALCGKRIVLLDNVAEMGVIRSSEANAHDWTMLHKIGDEGVVECSPGCPAFKKDDEPRTPSYYDMAEAPFMGAPPNDAATPEQRLITSAEYAREAPNDLMCRRCNRIIGDTARIPCGDCSDYPDWVQKTSGAREGN